MCSAKTVCPLSPSEREALTDACRIANSVLVGDADALRVAVALVTFAQILAGNDLGVRHALAAVMLDASDELTNVRRTDGRAMCNGHHVSLSCR
jgi:hypothetical protein